jgi:hypothetical protein
MNCHNTTQNTYTYTSKVTHTHIHTHAYARPCTHTFTYTYMYTFMHTHIPIHILKLNVPQHLKARKLVFRVDSDGISLVRNLTCSKWVVGSECTIQTIERWGPVPVNLPGNLILPALAPTKTATWKTLRSWVRAACQVSY